MGNVKLNAQNGLFNDRKMLEWFNSAWLTINSVQLKQKPSEKSQSPPAGQNRNSSIF